MVADLFFFSFFGLVPDATMDAGVFGVIVDAEVNCTDVGGQHPLLGKKKKKKKKDSLHSTGGHLPAFF